MAASVVRIARQTLTKPNRKLAPSSILLRPFSSSAAAAEQIQSPPPPPASTPSRSSDLNGINTDQVTVYDGSSVWNGSVVRGDLNKITVGFCSSIQERCVVHVAWSSPTGYDLKSAMMHGYSNADTDKIHRHVANPK